VLELKLQLPEKLAGLYEPKRYKVMHGGRGGGKSHGVAEVLLDLGARRPLRILCAREIQKSMRDSVHRLLKDKIAKLGLQSFYEVLDSEIRGGNGTLILFAGLQSHTVDSIKSFEGVDIVWVEEAHGVSKKSWDVLTPTIRKEGSEIWMTLNPDLETEETYSRWIAKPRGDTWVCQINWRDNPWFPRVLDDERRQSKLLDPDNYNNIWEGQPRRTAVGAIYAREVEKLYADRRVCRVSYDPRLPVHRVWDLGWSDYMAIALVQKTALDFRCISYYQESHKTLEQWIALMREDWNVQWGTDFMPHDARSGDYKSGTTAEGIAQEMGCDVHVLPAASVESGIRIARSLFPKAYVDEEECGDLLDCLKRYRRVIDPRTGLPGAPLHDEASHGADVWRYMGQAVPIMDNGAAQSTAGLKRRGSSFAR
jgi:phage terminase large subunit